MTTKTETTLAAALIAAQAEIVAPKKDREVTVKTRTGGSYTFAYATMNAMVEQLRPILTGHGLWFVQFTDNGHMVTRILHSSGQHIDCPVPMPSLPPAPQEAGSILTYFKRYSFCAAFGLVAEEEDDANIAQGNAYVPANRANGKVNEAQFRQLQDAVDRTGADLARFCAYFQVPSLKDVPAVRFGEALAALDAKAKRGNGSAREQLEKSVEMAK